MGKIKPIISNWLESDKGKDILTVMIVILVGVGSFELGRLSERSPAGKLKIEYNGEDLNEAYKSQSANVLDAFAIAKDEEKNFFASKRGKKYYPLGCSAGKTIKEQNRIYFKTGEEAESAGYSLSSSCN